MTLCDRLEWFQNMLLCCHDLYLWTFDRNMMLEYSNCPQASVISGLMAIGNRMEDTRSYAQSIRTPLLLSNEVGLMWIAASEREEKELRHIHVLGPFFMDSVSPWSMEDKVAQMGFNDTVRRDVADFFRSLPIISLSRALEYAAMLHYCIIGERIGVSDMNYWDTISAADKNFATKTISDFHGTYEAEQEMLRIVREGDWQSLKGHMNRMATLGSVGKLSNGNSMQQMKKLVEACITLFSRAAIEGGVFPEVSYSLSDHYYQRVEVCRSIVELTDSEWRCAGPLLSLPM